MPHQLIYHSWSPCKAARVNSLKEANMKKFYLIVPVVLALAGCDTPEQGALAGGAAGAAVGSAVAGDNDRLAGAVVGGVVGAAAGAAASQ